MVYLDSHYLVLEQQDRFVFVSVIYLPLSLSDNLTALLV